MFKRSFHSKDRAGKAVRPSKRSYREHTRVKLQQSVDSPPVGSTLTSPIITLVVGRDQRLFAAHEDVLSLSPFFSAALKDQFYESASKRVDLPDEEPEIFSCVLEYLYKGDYYPRLLHNKRRNSWELEDFHNPNTLGGRGPIESTINHTGVGGVLLKDTAIYCTAEKFGLEELKRLALRKQGLHSGIQIDVILRSARFAYDNTPDSDSRLRAHYLALIIRSRKTFKRSGTMQTEMEIGGSKLFDEVLANDHENQANGFRARFFDLFVAMCNHVDDIVDIANSGSPKSI